MSSEIIMPRDTRSFWVRNHPWVLPAVVLVLALLFRYLALWSLKKTIYFDFVLLDERLYHDWAVKIAGGTWQSGLVYEFAPLPAYLLALIYKVFSPDLIWFRYLNLGLGVFTCVLVYAIGRQLAGARVGLVAGLAAALYKPLIFFSVVPLKTALSVFLFAAFMAVLIRAADRLSTPGWLRAGILLGLLNNVRPNALIIVPAVMMVYPVLCLRGKKPLKRIAFTVAAFGAGLVLVQAPFMIRNFMDAGRAAATTSQSGIHLYLANNIDQQGHPPFASMSPAERGVQFTIEASRRLGRRLTPGEASAYWTGEVKRMALEQPFKFAGRLLAKVHALFSRWERGDHYHIDFMGRFAGFFALPFLSLGLVLPAGMAGMVTGAGRRGQRLMPVVVCGSYGLGLVIYFTSLRLRLPLVTVLIPFAVAGLMEAVRWFQSGRWPKLAAYGVTLVFFGLLAWLPIRHTGDLSAYFNTHAMILDNLGQREEAKQWWQQSSRMNRANSEYADLTLADQYYRENRMDAALDQLSKIGDHTVAAAVKFEIIGNIRFRQGDLRGAADAWEQSLAINSGRRRPRAKLIRLFARIDPPRARLEIERLRYIESFYDLYEKGADPP
ncbi:MAG: glycosyltransferase family 39 protein [Desulfobacterales bacterium]|nr:glycosyltransferase family 39 protein [Desulfobacterales bacterium]